VGSSPCSMAYQNRLLTEMRSTGRPSTSMRPRNSWWRAFQSRVSSRWGGTPLEDDRPRLTPDASQRWGRIRCGLLRAARSPPGRAPVLHPERCARLHTTLDHPTRPDHATTQHFRAFAGVSGAQNPVPVRRPPRISGTCCMKPGLAHFAVGSTLLRAARCWHGSARSRASAGLE